MRRRIMIVGAGFGQVPAIVAASKLGLEVIAVDRDENAPGFAIADISLKIDVRDIPAIVAAARSLSVHAAMTIQSDLPVPAVAEVVDVLGLKGISYKTALICSNKILTRIRLTEKGFPQPRYRVVDSLNTALAATREIGWPCIIKAPQSSGSRGVRKLTKLVDVPSGYEEASKYSLDGKLMVEEFIAGLEIGAQAFSLNGSCVKVCVHNDTLSEAPYMIPTGHSFPSKLPDRLGEKVELLCADSVTALGIHHGPSNIDIIIDPDRGPMLLEMGARIGATCIPELLEINTGIDWVKAAVQASLGDDVDLLPTRDQPCAALILESPANGQFDRAIIPDFYYNDTNVVKIEVTAVRGQQVSTLSNGTDRIGRVVVTGRDAAAAEELAKEIKSKINIIIKN